METLVMKNDTTPKNYTTEIITCAIIDTILIFAALAGNILTICAIIVTRKLSTMISNQFIFSLALSDLMVGLTVPYHLAFYLENTLSHQKYTCILRFVLICLACASSIYNLLATATDRYVAIVHPLHYNRYMTRKVATALILTGWILAFSLATMPIYWNKWDEKFQCQLVIVLPPNYVKFVLTPMFSLIWIAMLFVYLRIWREAAGHAKRLKNASHQGGQGINDSKSVQVVLLILGCFSICWLPYFVVITYLRLCQCYDTILYEAAFTMAIANSGINPLIYAWKNTHFREAFWCLLRCKSPNVVIHKNSFITNHVPTSKKNSLREGICNGIAEQDVTRSELDIEMHCSKLKQYNDKGCKQESSDLTVST